MTSDQIRAAAARYGKDQRLAYFLQVLGGTRRHPRDYSQELRYCGRQMVVLSEPLRRLGYTYIQADTHKYIYKLEACGYVYIGVTADPFARYVDHLVYSRSSSVILIAAAIDNNLVPLLEIIDITDEQSSNGIEGFWIRYLSWKRCHVVNSAQNIEELARFVKSSGGFRSVIANRLMGYEAATFPALLVAHACPPVSMTEMTKSFVPPWLA